MSTKPIALPPYDPNWYRPLAEPIQLPPAGYHFTFHPSSFVTYEKVLMVEHRNYWNCVLVMCPDNIQRWQPVYSANMDIP